MPFKYNDFTEAFKTKSWFEPIHLQNWTQISTQYIGVYFYKMNVKFNQPNCIWTQHGTCPILGINMNTSNEKSDLECPSVGKHG